MTLKYHELIERCKDRNFDRITVVVKDAFAEVAELQKVLQTVPGDIRVIDSRTDPGLADADGQIEYAEKQAVFAFRNMELCVVEPIAGETLYKKFLDNTGEGLCCVRERIPDADFDRIVEVFCGKGLKKAQTLENGASKAVWFDITEELGILYELIADSGKKITPQNVVPQRIAQINITTPDYRDTIEKITEYLEIGPWEVGLHSRKTLENAAFKVNGELKDVDVEYYCALLPCGNSEWEVIQPVRGELVYNDFIKRRKIGYHHILLEVKQDEWESEKKRYADNGMDLACYGSVGPVDWCYIETEEQIKFYLELRTDAHMTQELLPKAYLQYFYPEEAQ